MSQVELLENKAWALAKSPAGSIAQTMFMFWMYCNYVSIFTIVITGIYVRRANSEFDALTKQILDAEVKK